MCNKEFELNKAAENAKKEGTVSGKRITVVEASDWRCVNVEDSAKLYQMDILQSVCQCEPGPHALLLIIRVDSNYDEFHRKAVAEHLNLLGKDIWSHAMVVFNFGHWLGNITIEHYIESEGKALKWLVERCGNRYHLYNSTEDAEFTGLLEKIEEMVARNGGAHFEIDGKILQEVEERRKLEERAIARQMKVQRRRELIKATMGESSLPKCFVNKSVSPFEATRSLLVTKPHRNGSKRTRVCSKIPTGELYLFVVC